MSALARNTEPLFDDYDDYAKAYPDTYMEVHDGVPYMMAVPSVEHQTVSRNLTAELHFAFKGKRCQVFAAPFDYQLSLFGKPLRIVQPDLLVVCNPDHLRTRVLTHAPELIIEILTGNASYDRVKKFNWYQDMGVKEYWIVDPHHQTVDVYSLENGRYVTVQRCETHIKSGLFPDLELSYSDVFEGLTPLPPMQD